MHRSEDDAGDPIANGFLLAADGARGHLWTDPSTIGGGTSFLDWVFVTDPTYGAVGDDTANDTTAIQAAIDATPAGGVCYFPIPSVAYKITAALTIPRAMRLLGAGSYIGQYTKLHMATANTTAISNTGAYGLAIDGLQITGTIGGQTSGNALYTTGSLHLSRCLFQGFYDSLYVDQTPMGASPYFVNIEAGSIFDSATRDGIHLEGAVNNINVYGAEAGSNGRHGLYAAGGPYSIRVIGSTFEANATTNITIDGTGGSQSTRAVLITGNYFGSMSAAQTADVSIGPTTRVYGADIIGNYFEQSGAAALYHVRLNFVTGVRVAGGFIGQTSEAGAIISDATNTVNVILEYGNWTGTVTTPASTRILDPATSVTPSSVGVANSAGTSKYPAAADHVHAGTTYDTDGLIEVYPGAYSVAGDPPTVTLTSVWGVSGGVPYYDASNVTSGDEAALYYNPTNDEYVLVPYGF